MILPGSQWIAQCFQQPLPVIPYIIHKAAPQGVAHLEEPIPFARAKVAAGLRVLAEQLLFANLAGEILIAASIIEQSLNEKRHYHGIIRLHAFRGLLVGILVDFAPGDGLAGWAGR